MKTALIERIVSLLDLDDKRSYAILDFGCGNGALLSRISRSVSPDSELFGTDANETSIEKAKLSDGRIDFRCQKFTETLDYADETFDFVVSVDTLECIPNKSALLAEIARILRPGGRVLFAHWDWDTQVYGSEHKEIVRRLVASFSDWQQGWMEVSDGQMGRKLWGTFQESGLFHGEMQTHTLVETEYSPGTYGYDRLHDLSSLVRQGEVPRSEYDLILNEMDRLQKEGRFFYSLNSYLRIQWIDATHSENFSAGE